MATTCDKEGIRQAFEEVRDDKTDTNWAVFKYDGNQIAVSGSGTEYAEFLASFTDDERGFAFLRIFTGDELSKRAKFAFVAWIGSSVGALKRAKVSIDKALVKEIVNNFAVEVTTSELNDLSEENIKDLLIKAGGANYGTGGSK